MISPETHLRARWILPIVGPPLRDATIRFRNGWITDIGKSNQESARDLGEVAIVPAFVNAHVHLELCDRDRPLALAANSTFADWLRSVLAYRQDRLRVSGPLPNSIHTGLSRSIQSGTGALCDTSMSPDGAMYEASQLLGYVACLEGLGLSRERFIAVQDLWRKFLDGMDQGESFQAVSESSTEPNGGDAHFFLRGLSPHAPYSTSIQLVEAAVELSRRHRCLLAMHLAETSEEIELLSNHTGPLRGFLEERNVWPRDPHEVLPSSTAPYLETLAEAARVLVIHGNLLSPAELDLLACHRDRMALVHCPRTHSYFQRASFDLSGHLARGVRIAIGTDSCASNPDVSMLGELQAMMRMYPQVSPEQLWSLVTTEGARALSLADRAGGLAPGRPASFVAIKLDGAHGSSPWEQAAGPASRIVGVWRWGEGGEPLLSS
jgi:aminodeoxyfutalosine deaminase